MLQMQIVTIGAADMSVSLESWMFVVRVLPIELCFDS